MFITYTALCDPGILLFALILARSCTPTPLSELQDPERAAGVAELSAVTLSGAPDAE